MSSTSERAATSRVRLRRPAIIEPPELRNKDGRRRTLITWVCGFDILLVPLMVLQPDWLQRLFPNAARPLVFQIGFSVLLVLVLAGAIFAWDAAMRQHCEALAEADGIGC